MAAAVQGREQAELRRVAGGLDGGGRRPHTLAPASPPPTPCSTASSVAVTATEGGCLDDVNAYAVQFNTAAKNLLERLNTKLPDASMFLADCYSIVMELIEHPQKYGFKLVTPLRFTI
uniref:Uncharacterized protein n=1 Tax=Oryza barthii TaxID=65489 RepID=A0A0D3F3V9_9ORYZ